MTDKYPVNVHRFPSPSDMKPRKSDNGGSNGGGGDMLESRVARIEAHVAHLDEGVRDLKQDLRDLRKDMNTDFRLLLGAGIAAVAVLAGLMAKGFGWL